VAPAGYVFTGWDNGGTSAVVSGTMQVVSALYSRGPGRLTVLAAKVLPTSVRFTYAYDTSAPVTAFVVVNEDGTLACSSDPKVSTCTAVKPKGTVFYAYAVNGTDAGPRDRVSTETRAIRIEDCSRVKNRITCFGTSTGYTQGAILKPSIRFPGQTRFSEGAVKIRVDAAGNWQWSRTTLKRTAVRIHGDDSRVRSNTVIVEAR
jgi:hypothetical protein